MKYSIPRGTKDILPADSPLWQKLEAICRHVFGAYNYHEIRTPVFEKTELFTRSIGNTTDIVKKEMYEFKDRKGRSLCLRPEETAPVVRAGLENGLIRPDQVTKLYYIGPMFRYERPQAGRQRQFHQAGVEVFGSADPLIDAEVILMNVQLFEALGLMDLEVNMNSVGCPKCRPEFRQQLKAYFKDNISKMCDDCRDRFEHNPLRILDCKEAKCQKFINSAPASVDTLCADCKTHFEEVIKMLDYQEAKVVVNKRLVRGLDYYNRTTFEVVAKSLGAQNAISGGGRYDDLVAELGGKPTPAVGFAIGIERVIEVLKKSEIALAQQPKVKIFFAALGDEARKLAFDLVIGYRERFINADMDYLGKSLKSQLKLADKLGAEKVIILGEDELKKGYGIIKDMKTSKQEEVKLDSLAEVM
ncbi:MAG: histidine--tRNA ligase [Candidatus Margulisbacteria bacterium]|nr:histidine--tRNA ligase [Candidatus Margulisiibacteriota bacterium]